jgi:hypothetical protein
VARIVSEDVVDRLKTVPLLATLSVHQHTQLANLFTFERCLARPRLAPPAA